MSAARRFALVDLLRTPSAELRQAFRSRLAARRADLGAAAVPSDLRASASHIERSMEEAEGEASALAALATADAGVVAAVRTMPPASHATTAAQALLRAAFSTIIGCRALAQSAAVGDGSSERRGLLPSCASLRGLLEDTVEDARAFCREKYGDSPEIRIARVVQSGTGATARADSEGVVLAPFVTFALHELLKNSMGAHCRLVGADQLDRLPPIEVRHGTRAGDAFISVTDYGGGWTAAAPEDAQRFLHTSNPEREPTYTYSRNFGAQFEGLGMGLPLAALHARYHGGALHLSPFSKPPILGRLGVHAGFTFRIAGDDPEPDDVPWAAVST
jgi:hypothetical protein